MGDFLSRPVEIRTDTFSLGASPNFSFDPWSEFLNSLYVRNRIEGYKHVRGNLCLRFVINGNPYLSGRFMYYYVPRPLDNIVDQVTPFGDARLIQGSQHMHIMCDPTTGEGGLMKLPFFCPENWIDLTSTRSISAMGKVQCFSAADFRSANSATGTCTVRVYAWMEDMELSGPTASAYASWTPQASELLTSPVSKLSSAAAKAAGALAMIPEIGPYMKATEMGLNAISKVAHLFGMSSPAIITERGSHVGTRRNFLGDLALATTNDPTTRLGLDVKGELTIDPRTVGLPPVDEMSFDYLVQKENIFHRVSWGISDSVGTSLEAIKVTPCQFGTDTTTIENRSMLTTQAAVASMFHFWRGTIIYRFRVVASALHRGRLRIVYDPVDSTASAMNQTYSRIIDLEHTRDFEIPITWNAMESFLRVSPPGVGTTDFNHGNTITHEPTFENGALRIEVLTPLITPDPSLATGAQILVSQRMTPDYEFGYPSNFISSWKLYSASAEGMQSGILVDSNDEPNEPEQASEAIPAVGDMDIPTVDHTCDVFMGESPKSYRTIGKRYQLGRNVSSTSAHTNAVRNTKTEGLTVLEYIMWQYVGWRGSMRFKNAPSNGKADRWYSVALHNGFGTFPFLDQIPLGGHWEASAISVEVPFYSNKRFAPARGAPGWSDYDYDTFNALDPNYRSITIRTNSTDGHTQFLFKKFGEDFSLFFHVGLPALYAV